METGECPKYKKGLCDGSKCQLNHFSLCGVENCKFKGCTICLDIGKRQSNIDIFLKLQKQAGMDIVFCLDTTGSMDPYIESTKNSVLQIIKSLKSSFDFLGKELTEKIRIGLICYKDKAEKVKGLWEKVDLNANLEEFNKVLSSHKAQGGGDAPEDVKGAFQMVLNEMTWEAQMKFVILVTDAPAHGKIYHDTMGDDYPDEDMQEELKKMAKKKIKLIALRLNSQCDKMFNIFSTVFQIENSRFQSIQMQEFHSQLQSSSSKINYDLLQVFSNKISRPLIDMTMVGFTASKMPDDYLITSLQKEIAKAAQRRQRTEDKNYEKRKISIYCVNLDYDKFQKERILEVSYNKFQEDEFMFYTQTFSSGSVRDCYLIKKNETMQFIAKTPKLQYGYDNFTQILEEWKGNMLSQLLAEDFNKQLNKAKIYGQDIEFQRIFLAELQTPDNKKIIYAVEQLLKYPYVKYNNNMGQILKVEKTEKELQDYQEEFLKKNPSYYKEGSNVMNFIETYQKYKQLSEIAQCFSHWTFQFTKGNYMIVDLQGDQQFFTDPILLTNNIENTDSEESTTNTGALGIFAFFKQHVCNDYCKKLSLLQNKEVYSLNDSQIQKINTKIKEMEEKNEVNEQVNTFKTTSNWNQEIKITLSQIKK